MSNLIKKISWVTFGDIANKGIMFAITIYVAGVLGTESYGVIITALAVVGYADWISDLGLKNVGTRETAKPSKKREFKTQDIFLAKVILGVIVSISFYLLIPYLSFKSEEIEVVRTFIFLVIPYALIIEWYYNGKQEYHKAVIGSFIGKVTILVLIIAFVKQPDDVIYVPYAYIIGTLIFAFVLLAYLPSKNYSVRQLNFSTLPKSLFKKGFQVGTGGFMAQTVQLLPPLVISISLNFQQAGLYGAAFKIILIAMIIDRVFVTILIPTLSSQWVENKEQALKNIKSGYKILLFAGFGLSLFASVFSNQIIALFYPSEYAESAQLLEILSLFIAGTFINSLFSFGLIAIGKDKTYFYSTIMGGVFATALIISASFMESAYWIAISVVLAEFGIMLFSLFAFQSEVKLHFFLSFIIALVITRASFYLSGFLEFHWLLNGSISLGFFVLIMMLTKQINISDFRWLKERIAA